MDLKRSKNSMLHVYSSVNFSYFLASYFGSHFITVNLVSSQDGYFNHLYKNNRFFFINFSSHYHYQFTPCTDTIQGLPFIPGLHPLLLTLDKIFDLPTQAWFSFSDRGIIQILFKLKLAL